MQTKCCTKCGEEKSVVEFHKGSRGKYGVKSVCKVCVKSYSKDRYRKKSEKILSQQKRYRDSNPEKIAAWTRKYQASKLNRTPSWLNKAHHVEIEGLYLYNQVMPGDWHVDHIFPLQGKEVSGLHVPSNLQVITAKENRAKSNLL